MKKKKVILIILLIILVVFGIYITYIYFTHDNKGEQKNVVKMIYDESNLPIDDAIDDNQKLYGNWNCEKIEVYRNGKNVSTMDSNDKVIQISNDDKLSVCYIEYSNDNNLKCETVKYSFINGILYAVNNKFYLPSKSDVILKDEYLILKSYLDDEGSKEDYSLLYFVKK